MTDDVQERGDAGAAPDASTQGVQSGDEERDDSETVTLQQESNLGPGAGANPVVKTTAPVQREGDPVTTHPTLREVEQPDEQPGTTNP